LLIGLLYRRHSQRLMQQVGQQQAKRIADMQAMLNAMPIPLWRRDGAGHLVTCNQFYADQLGLTAEAVVDDQTELGASVISDGGLGLHRRAMQVGQPQSESHHIIVKGQRRLLEFHEIPLAGQNGGGDRQGIGTGSIGFALDYTALEDTQQQLARQRGRRCRHLGKPAHRYRHV
jgi:PAS domain-containing protein